MQINPCMSTKMARARVGRSRNKTFSRTHAVTYAKKHAAFDHCMSALLTELRETICRQPQRSQPANAVEFVWRKTTDTELLPAFASSRIPMDRCSCSFKREHWRRRVHFGECLFVCSVSTGGYQWNRLGHATQGRERWQRYRRCNKAIIMQRLVALARLGLRVGSYLRP